MPAVWVLPEGDKPRLRIICLNKPVISIDRRIFDGWIPAFAGMTINEIRSCMFAAQTGPAD
jgi:hypothetical protein